jgi:lipoate-protein ligase A
MGPVRGASSRKSGGCLTKAVDAQFVVLERAGSPEALLQAAYRTWDVCSAVVCQATSSALVLGSSQRQSDFDLARCRAAGLDIVRRRSGGGAVVVRPGAQVWVDFFVPREAPLFEEDVVAAFSFVGEIWRAAIVEYLPSVSADSIAVASGRPSSGPAAADSWSSTLCFAGLGAGEVSIDGRKVVGVSQRRDRNGAWFHSMALVEFDPEDLAFALGGPESRRREAAACLSRSAVALPTGQTATVPIGRTAAVPTGRTAAELLTEAIVSRLA